MSEKVKRFYERFIPVTESGCWLWFVSNSPLGYGMFNFKGDSIPAHRFSYELFKGPIPKGLHIDHLCRVTCCVNPDHLEAVTAKVNTHRGIGPTAKNVLKTHCPKGHPFSKENTKITTKGWRACILCCREQSTKRYHKYGLEVRRARDKRRRERLQANQGA